MLADGGGAQVCGAVEDAPCGCAMVGMVVMCTACGGGVLVSVVAELGVDVDVDASHWQGSGSGSRFLFSTRASLCRLAWSRCSCASSCAR